MKRLDCAEVVLGRFGLAGNLFDQALHEKEKSLQVGFDEERRVLDRGSGVVVFVLAREIA